MSTTSRAVRTGSPPAMALRLMDGNDVNLLRQRQRVSTVAADRVGLLVDEVSNSDGFDREMAQDALDHAIDSSATAWTRRSDLSYDMAYLDLVDTD